MQYMDDVGIQALNFNAVLLVHGEEGPCRPLS